MLLRLVIVESLRFFLLRHIGTITILKLLDPNVFSLFLIFNNAKLLSIILEEWQTGNICPKGGHNLEIMSTATDLSAHNQVINFFY